MARKKVKDFEATNPKQDQNNAIYSGTEDLQSSENALVSYNTYIVEQFLRYSNFLNLTVSEKEQKRTLDFGAGVGSLAVLWFETSGIKVDCFEIDPRQRALIEGRGLNALEKLNEKNEVYDFVYSSNVLEHIENDSQTLDELASLIKPQGRIAIYVPAFSFLFSELDRSVGHYRRYGKKELETKVTASGFRIVRCRYVDSVGFFASLLIKILGWKGIGNIGSNKSLIFYDRFVFPISQFFDFITAGKILGKNLILIAEKS
jgi:2-polyprenyl-3-methyl-5-hydroxy-6-metoxy-1,4-benzoquinol methylase